MKPLTCLDLFAGCGGLSLGLGQAGLAVRWANERDPDAATTYRLAHPETTMIEEDAASLFERIREGGDRKLPRPGDVDVVAGGPPCQGFSGYNRYRKPDDPRNSLVDVFFDYVNFLRPRFVLMENVPGMLAMDQGSVPKLLMAALQSLEYTAGLGILQAGYYGLPQNRWRVFIVAAARSEKIPMFPQPTHSFPRTTIFGATAFRSHVVKPPAEKPDLFWQPEPTVTVGDAIADLPAIENGGGSDECAYELPADGPFQVAMRGGSSVVRDHRCVQLGALMMTRCRAVPKRAGAGWLDLPDELKPRNLVRHGDKRYVNRFGRLHWEGTFNTILGRCEPYWSRVFHPTQDRVLSVRECARAQALPDRLSFTGALAARYMQAGNAVPPPVAKALGSEILRAAGRLQAEK